MTPLIIDASVAVKWLAEEVGHAQAVHLLRHGASLFRAPSCLVAEVVNASLHKGWRGEVGEDTVRDAKTFLFDAIPQFDPDVTLIDNAIPMAQELKHSLYDCLYLASAAEAVGFVVTADRKLVEKVRGTPYALHVRALADAERVLAFAHMSISLSAFNDIVRVAEASTATKSGVYDQVSRKTGKFSIVAAGDLDIASPNHLRLENALKALSVEARADLLALARFGDALPGEYDTWEQCRDLGNTHDMEPYFLGYMQPRLLLLGLERFLSDPP